MLAMNTTAYIGRMCKTLAVVIASPECLDEERYYGTINNQPQAVQRFFQKNARYSRQYHGLLQSRAMWLWAL